MTTFEKVAAWKDEFYPTPAVRVGAENALSHSLLKWEGLKRENLQRHGLSLEELKRVFQIDSTTCALCIHHLADDCQTCPLYLVRKNTRCDKKMDGEKTSPYSSLRAGNNPLPMIKWLKKAEKYEKNQKQQPDSKKPLWSKNDHNGKGGKMEGKILPDSR